jgi:hypothetical protein
MLMLPDVTLVAIDSTPDPTATEQSLVRSASRVRFGRLLCLSTRPIVTAQLVALGCEWVRIPPLLTLSGYSRYCLAELHRHITTSHCLTIQSDSWIETPEAWDDAWLQYDYIGALWPPGHSGTDYRVGNSGFCLRSKQLLEATAVLPNDSYVWRGRRKDGCRDDVITCVMNREYLEARGLRFAPVDVAARFAFELPVPEAPSPEGRFGRHDYRRRKDKDRPRL